MAGSKNGTKSEVMLDTETIKFDDGSWWEIRTFITRGMRKKLRVEMMAGLALPESRDIDMEDKEAVKSYLMEHLSTIDVNNQDDGYLLYGTVAWSFDNDINIEAIDELDDHKVEYVLVKMKEFYDVTEDTLKKGITTQ